MNPKLMKRVGTIIIGLFAIFNIFTLAIADRFPIGDPTFGEYSIYSSKEFFFVYHLWGIVLAVICIYAMWQEIRILFMISLFLLCVLMFYPYFTTPNNSVPTNKKDPKVEGEAPNMENEVPPGDSVILDTLPKDS